MGLLQDLPDKYGDPILVTLNPPFEPKPELTYGRYKYDHPILSEEVTIDPPFPPRPRASHSRYSRTHSPDITFTRYNFFL